VPLSERSWAIPTPRCNAQLSGVTVARRRAPVTQRGTAVFCNTAAQSPGYATPHGSILQHRGAEPRLRNAARQYAATPSRRQSLSAQLAFFQR
jgi:hypothetical protein